MWWPWKTRKAERNRDAAREDCHSLGNLLLKSGMITVDQLRSALEFQDANPDHMLGEALVQMGAVKKDVVDALLAAQRAKRAANGKHSADVVNIAKNRKGPLTAAHDRFVETAMLMKKG